MYRDNVCDVLYNTGVGSGGGGGGGGGGEGVGKGGMCPPTFLIGGGQWYVCAPHF